MTLIITALLAIIATIVRFASPEFGSKYKFGLLALITWGAALMWSIDGFAALLAGEPFVELTDTAVVADDALLGATIAGVALAIWLLSLALASVKTKLSQSNQSHA